MSANYIVTIAIVLGLVSLYWILHGLMLLPVKAGDNSNLVIRINVTGECKELEHMLKGLIWLRDNGTLKSEIEIDAVNPDNSLRLVALAFTKDYQFISYNEIGDI